MNTIEMPAIKTPRTAIDAFDIKAVSTAALANAKAVRLSPDFLVEFDTEATVNGCKMDVKVLYPNNHDDISVYRLNDAAEPVEPEVAQWLSTEDHERLFDEAESAYIEKKAENAEAAYEDSQDRKCREILESRVCRL